MVEKCNIYTCHVRFRTRLMQNLYSIINNRAKQNWITDQHFFLQLFLQLTVPYLDDQLALSYFDSVLMHTQIAAPQMTFLSRTHSGSNTCCVWHRRNLKIFIKHLVS